MWFNGYCLTSYECDELYELYLRLAERTLDEIRETVPAGECQQYFLDMHCPLPKEHFEARLFQLAEDPDRLAEVIDRMHSADLCEEIDGF